MKNNPLQAVIWDMDGVIADTGQSHFKSWQQAFEKRGKPFSERDFQSIFGQRNDSIIRKIMKQDLSPAEIEAIARDKEEYFRKTVIENLKPFPGVVGLLKNLKEKDIASAIASSAPLENITLILNRLDIEGYFQVIVYGQEVTEGKPSPQLFLLAARKLGVDPRNCAVIEDAVAGVAAAKKAAMRCIAVTNTHPAENLAEADLVINSLEKVDYRVLSELFTNF